MTIKGRFNIRKTANVGISNPIVSRLTEGLQDIVLTAQLPEKSRIAVQRANHEVMKNIVKAQKISDKIRRAIEVVLKNLDREGVKTQASERCVDLPTTDDLDDIRDFIKYSKKALRELVKIPNVILGTTFLQPHHHKLLKVFEERYGVNDPIYLCVKEDRDLWIELLLNLRNQDEHPSTDQLYFDFDINWIDSDQKWAVTPPRFYNEIPIYEYVKSTIYNLLTFAEELNILLLQKLMPSMVVIREIPEDMRDKNREIRFTLELKELAER